MIINPIVVGVVATVLVELIAIFIIALASYNRGKHR